jgi:hypothetical protein
MATHAAQGGNVDISSRGICQDIGEEGLYTPGIYRLHEEEEIYVTNYLNVIDEQ